MNAPDDLNVLAELVAPTSLSAAPETPKQTRGVLAWERALLGLSDYVNPILVKESRQALKSRQFAVTFGLLLICAVGWAMLAILSQMPEIYYRPGGKDLLYGFYLIVAVPLLVIVPFSAFRSLTSEREDGTWDLISITALSSRQIITGKLGSAIMQMSVYYAAIAPCITLTYLLRGVDIISIVVMLVYTLLLSVLLSAFGLLFAGVSQSRAAQAVVSVALIVILFVVLWAWSFLVYGMLYEQAIPLDMIETWIAQLFTLNMYATYLALFVLCAAAQNTFASENRSTKLRVTMLVQLVCFAGWVIYWSRWLGPQFFIAFIFGVILAAMHWVIFGALMIGEVAELSPRAKRDLPQSYLGRSMFTWFNPGAATGYVYAVLTFAVFSAVLMATAFTQDMLLGQPGLRFGMGIPQVARFALLVNGYVAFYLGLSYLVVRGLRRLSKVGLAVSVLMTALIVTAGAVVPYFTALWWNRFRMTSYDEWQFLNWAWTLGESLRSQSAAGVTGFATIVVPILGCGMFGVGLLLAHREVEKVRQETPERIREDDAERRSSRATSGKPIGLIQ